MRQTLNYFLTTFLLLAVCIACDNSSDDSQPNNPLFATWRISAVKVSDATLTQQAPNGEDILISFEEDGTFSGTTSANSFQGRYELQGNTLTMTEFFSTEVADTPFAGAFYESITEAQVPDTTYAQFGYSFEGNVMTVIFGSEGFMTLQAQ